MPDQSLGMRQNDAPERTLQNSETQRRGARKMPKTRQKRGVLRTENGASESGKKKPLAKLRHSHGREVQGQTRA